MYAESHFRFLIIWYSLWFFYTSNAVKVWKVMSDQKKKNHLWKMFLLFSLQYKFSLKIIWKQSVPKMSLFEKLFNTELYFKSKWSSQNIILKQNLFFLQNLQFDKMIDIIFV